MQINKNEKGVATTIVILILSTVFVLMGFVFAFRGISKLEEAQTAIDGDKSEYAAKSGVDEALLQLRRNPSYSGTGAIYIPIEKDSAGNIKSSVNITISPNCTTIIKDNDPGLGEKVCKITSIGSAGKSLKKLVVEVMNDHTYEAFHPIISKQYFE